MILFILLMPLIIGTYFYYTAVGWKTLDRWIVWNVCWGILFVIALLFAVITKFETASLPEERDALQMSYEDSREYSEFERLSITKDVAEFNRSLAKYKYWNDSWMISSWINDDVEDIEPIK